MNLCYCSCSICRTNWNFEIIFRPSKRCFERTYSGPLKGKRDGEVAEPKTNVSPCYSNADNNFSAKRMRKHFFQFRECRGSFYPMGRCAQICAVGETQAEETNVALFSLALGWFRYVTNISLSLFLSLACSHTSAAHNNRHTHICTLFQV